MTGGHPPATQAVQAKPLFDRGDGREAERVSSGQGKVGTRQIGLAACRRVPTALRSDHRPGTLDGRRVRHVVGLHLAGLVRRGHDRGRAPPSRVQALGHRRARQAGSACVSRLRLIVTLRSGSPPHASSITR